MIMALCETMRRVSQLFFLLLATLLLARAAARLTSQAARPLSPFIRVSSVAPGMCCTKRVTGEFRASGTYTFGNLNVDQGFYYLNSTGGVDATFGATNNTVTVANGAAVGAGVSLTSPITRSWSLRRGLNGAGFILPVGSTNLDCGWANWWRGGTQCKSERLCKQWHLDVDFDSIRH